jgi:hypothetical protein
METNDKKPLHIKVTPNKELLEAIKYASNKDLLKDIQNEMVNIGMEADERMKRSMLNTGKAHWFYRRPNGTIHFPSAPGYPPAVDSGRLIGSIVLDVREGSVEIGSNEQSKSGLVNYALPLEEGTDRIKARPFVKPIADWMESVASGRLFDVIKDKL